MDTATDIGELRLLWPLVTCAPTWWGGGDAGAWQKSLGEAVMDGPSRAAAHMCRWRFSAPGASGANARIPSSRARCQAPEPRIVHRQHVAAICGQLYRHPHPQHPLCSPPEGAVPAHHHHLALCATKGHRKLFRQAREETTALTRGHHIWNSSITVDCPGEPINQQGGQSSLYLLGRLFDAAQWEESSGADLADRLWGRDGTVVWLCGQKSRRWSTTTTTTSSSSSITSTSNSPLNNTWLISSLSPLIPHAMRHLCSDATCTIFTADSISTQ